MKVLFKLSAWILILAICFFGLELAFRAYLRLINREDIYLGLIKFEELLERAWFEPHPHLVYVFKPNNKFTMNTFNRPTVTSNSFGFRSTLEYDVIERKKPANTLRIATLGGSTTMGINSDNEIWPYFVGKNLSVHYPDKKIEILNEGMMGYTSLDNLIDLALRVIDFDCDIHIIYLGINDYSTIAPLDIYRTDNSHYRKTLWENVSFSFVELMPEWLLRSKVLRVFLIKLGVTDRRSLLDNTGTRSFRRMFKNTNEDKKTVHNKIRDNAIRNITSMAGIIKAHDPDALIFISSFYHFDDPTHIQDLNSELRQYADNSDIIFVDAAKKMPRSRELVFDYGHFTKKGEKYIARVFSEAIVDALKH